MVIFMHDLSLVDVTKQFGRKTAVSDINLRLKSGVYGLLGENGSGKTTLLRMICGILKPTRGLILCDGMQIDRMGGEYRGLLGYLPQDFGYYRDFTAYRFLNYIAALKAVPEDSARMKIEELLELTGLGDVKDKKLKTYSGGMLRRVGIAQALLNDPEILILDEPTAGLDPKERVRFRNLLSALGKRRIVILSTHIVSDIEYIADEIFIMKNGEIIINGSCEALVKGVEGYVWKCFVQESEAQEWNRRYIIGNLKSNGSRLELKVIAKEKPCDGAERQEASLEDVFMYYLQSGGNKYETI